MLPLIPETAPFSPEQRAWLNGFFSGFFAPATLTPQTSHLAPHASGLIPLTILFGSQTGTAEGLAKKAAKEAGRRGFAPMVLDMAQSRLAALSAEKNVIVIVSTYGDGEPPDTARALHAELDSQLKTQNSKPKTRNPGPETRNPEPTTLEAIRFSVCSLGDTNYAHFCQCGKDFDERLERLGATRVTPRTDCDLDYETPFNAWLDRALSALSATTPSESDGPPSAVHGPLASSRADHPLPTVHSPPSTVHSRANPFPARLLTSRNLNGSGSAKQVQHVEFSLDGSGLAYEAGDALGVVPHNCPDLVTEVLAALGFDGEEAVPAPDGSTTSLRRALTELYDLGKPTPDLVDAAGASAAGHHVIDTIVSSAGFKPAPSGFIRTLKKLQPRLYSISSSPKAHPGQVHLTVGAVRYEKDGRARKGVCSTFLADRAVPGESSAGVFVHSNRAFRPPASGDAAMIMIGPGTGIAPFRAFLHERRATGATGKAWLFFGDQRSSTDFLYRDELGVFQSDGTLTRLDTAFSRDQPDKIYVQHRMLEHAAGIYAWLESGAHFYVCGDASRMAKDVDSALHEIVRSAGGKSQDEAAAYVAALRTSKRYARDVY